MAMTIETGEIRQAARSMVRDAVSAYLDVAASSARIGPVVLADLFLAGGWTFGATAITTVLGTALLSPLGLRVAFASSAMDLLIWLVAIAIPVACHRYRSNLETARGSRPGEMP